MALHAHCRNDVSVGALASAQVRRHWFGIDSGKIHHRIQKPASARAPLGGLPRGPIRAQKKAPSHCGTHLAWVGCHLTDSPPEHLRAERAARHTLLSWTCACQAP